MTSSDNCIIIDLKESYGIFKGFASFYENKKFSDPLQFDKSITNSENLSNLAIKFLDDRSTSIFLHAYNPLTIEIAARIITNEDIEKLYLAQENYQTSISGSISLNALAKIITSTNEISTLTEYFLQKKQFFAKLKSNFDSLKHDELQLILLAFYRLINSDRQRFYKYIDPEVLYSILSNESSSSINKYLSIKILSSYLYLSEKVRLQMIDTHVNQEELSGYYEGDNGINYKLLPIMEAKRLSNLSKLKSLESVTIESQYTVSFTKEDLSDGVSLVSGILVPNLTSLNNPGINKKDIKSEFVPIEKSSKALKELATSIQRSQPAMLVGRAGSGKTFLINELAKFLHMDSNSIIKIHLNQQTDSKLLLGTYSSGSTPGSFEWKNGVLTTAVQEGRWVLVEDIDKAPNEVLSILLSLLENRELTIPSRGEVIKAANGFQLISTIRAQGDSKKIIIPDMIGLRLWKTIELQDLESDELKIILNKKFPLLERFSNLFIKCFLNVKDIYNSRRFISMNKGSQPRLISIRDLIKFCNRCNRIMINAGIKTIDDLVQDELFDAIFQEAVDCFTSSVVEKDPIEALVQTIGSSLEVPTSRINLHLTRHVPVFLDFDTSISIGRAHLDKNIIPGLIQKRKTTGNATSFARTNHSLRLMEKVGVGISMCEPLLLVGETGTGKTTVVQEMAKLLDKKLTVINVSQQTEVGDLLGGFKPVNTKTIALPIQEDFEELFNRSFSIKKNAQFIKLLAKCFNKSQWKNVSRLWKEAYKMAKTTYQSVEENDDNSTEESNKKKRKLNESDKAQLMAEWKNMNSRVINFEKQALTMENSFVFKFIEGSLVKAVRNGEWLLLDEMNLASPETLDSISDLLSEEIEQRNILLSEKGDIESIVAHNDFRIFGCMNPATDVGKKDLPAGIRSRFTELYVHSPDEDISDLLMIIDKYIGKYSITDEWVGNDIAALYLEAKKLSDRNQIVDGANQKPHFSIRTLTRTLLYVRDIVSIYGLRRSLYEGFCMSFLTLLDLKSEAILKPLIEKYTIGRLKNARSIVSQIPPNPSDASNPDKYVQFRHYWMRHGPSVSEPQAHYIITPFVEKNMMNLVRATSGRRFPVLIQGPTSAGKTSMINHLAKITGHKFVRINNHEHTDLQEYLGTYLSDDTGKLVFKEGILVEALRKGHWIVLDELNLAPTDVLEALNRLLDDNRELFIPETQEVVRPHPDFMLFATQNPPGLYGGRKVLSKAFRNRFLELHFDDIPQDELEVILRERCQIAPTYAKKIVSVYKELSVQRQSTRLFEQKNSFATLRDLFRWAQREAVGYEQLAANGYMLLAERVRKPEEKALVKQVIETVMKVKLDMDAYYASLETPGIMEIEGPVVWTKAFRRLAVLVTTSMKYNEPLLLVGETGCGKTTVCQLIAQFYNKELTVVNAHQNTETGDLLGAQRPIRNRSELQAKLSAGIRSALESIDVEVSEKESLESLISLYDSNKTNESLTQELKDNVEKLKNESNSLFEWCDGPLISSMKNSHYFLLDEISLADDSVLERLNSVLEPERSLLLAEKGTDDAFITAGEGFQFLATMNPGGDYGKKELSPALRNRFTEIWVPSMDDFDDVRQIVESRLDEGVKQLTEPVVQFSEWYGMKIGGSTTNGVISLRDILAWVSFINSACKDNVSPNVALLHGACMVFIDALGTNNTASLAENEAKLKQMKYEFVDKLSEFTKEDLRSVYDSENSVNIDSEWLSCGNFRVSRAEGAPDATSFNLQAPTTASNAMRVIRAMQVHKPILLEGSPGVGKTSLVSALAQATGNNLIRINLSEQTDLIDLFGSDSPVEGGEAGEFVWRDAPFLRAMQRGEWVLLDEMNLASQSVLEGLNACLDHRSEAYIAELDRSFKSHPNFLVFAAQNPQYQGGGRKGLPKSFINRFTVVYVDMLTEPDLQMIATHLYPALDREISNKMIRFMSKLEDEVVVKRSWGSSGGPWEFNLRDTLRWLSLLDSHTLSKMITPGDFFDLIVKQRFRTADDRDHSEKMFEEIFGPREAKDSFYQLGVDYAQCNGELIKRREFTQYFTNNKLSALQCNFEVMETVMRCINHAWPLLLVGPSNSGKTELIRFASSIVGAKVYEFSMNSDIDSMDILGGYEQADISRELSEFSNEIVEFLLELLAVNLQVDNSNSSVLTTALKIVHFLTSTQLTVENFKLLSNSFSVLQESISGNETFQILNEKINTLNEKVKEVASVKFQWFDGLLVQAVEKGHWLILDNANLCSPSVLDRLNSLLEINGTLIINECTNDDGSPRCVTPHPNFRLFLTADPKYGELSRAMRNRGVEIYLEPLGTSSTSFDKNVLGFNDNIEHTDINEKLDDLKISETILGKPVYGYTDAYDSQIRTMSTVIDVHDIYNNKDTNKLINLTTGVIPINSVSEVDSFMINTIRSSEFSEEFVDFIAALSKKLNFIKELGYISRLQTTYESSLQHTNDICGKEINYGTSQPLMPSLSSYILPSLNVAAPSIESNEVNYFFEVVNTLADANEYMKSLRSRAETSKITELSYIERSAAASFGRNIKRVPRLRIYQLVNSIFVFVKSEISVIIENDTLWTSNNTFKFLFDICQIWTNLVGSSEVQNESKLRVYQQQLFSWIEAYSAQVKSINLPMLVESVKSFAKQFVLTRGSAMASLWDHSRSIYPSSALGWRNFELLSAVAQEFDEVCLKQFPESTDMVNDLRKMILVLFEDCLLAIQSDEFDKMVENLRASIIELDKVSDDFLNKRDHKYSEEFDLLLNFVDSSATAKQQPIKLTGENLKFSLEASRSTLSLSKFSKVSLFKPYPRVFDSLWKSDGPYSISNVGTLFNDEFFQRMMNVNLTVKNVAGGKISESLGDLRFLSSLLVDNSANVLENHLLSFKTILLAWVSFVIEIHAETLPKENHEAFEPFLTSIKENTYKKESLAAQIRFMADVGLTSLAGIFETFFAPALLQLQSPTLGKVELGKAWVSVSCGLIQLYVPDSAYDPAIADHVVYDNYVELQKVIDLLKSSWVAIRTVVSGDKPLIAEGLTPEIGEEQIPKAPRVYRSGESIDALFEEWSSFIESSVDTKHVEKLLSVATELSDKAASQVENFQQNSAQFVLRLKESYSRYADLNDVLTGYIYGIKFGLELLHTGTVETTYSDITSLWPADPSIILSPSKIEKVFTEIKEICKTAPVDYTHAEAVYTFFINLSITQGNNASLASNANDYFNQVLIALYYRWSLRRLKQEEQESVQMGVFVFADPTVDAEKDFQRMFPDAEDIIDASASEEFKAAYDVDNAYFEISKAYIEAFSKEKVNVPLIDLVTKGSSVLPSLSKLSQRAGKGVNSAPVLSSIISQLHSSIQSFTESADSKDLDFYSGYSTYETRKAGIVVSKLQTAVHGLLKQWPEHATLQYLFRICSEFLEFPSVTPVYRLLTKVEQVYTFIGEWEKYAHSGVSLKTHLESIAALIVSWRKLELVSWKQVFVNEDKAIERKMGKWWFHLFESIILPATQGEFYGGDNEVRVVSAINVFLSQTSYGEFHHRLNLLNAFVEHVHLLAPESPIYDSLLNVISFYKQFKPMVDDSVAAGKKKLEKDVKEIILLASWKDINIDALKQSSRRSHHNLYKIIRKYRDLLSQPIAPLIEAGLGSNIKTSVPQSKLQLLPVDIDFDTQMIYELCGQISTWEQRPARLRKLEIVHKNMSIYVKRFNEEELPQIQEFAMEIVNDAELLRKETPSQLTEENKSMCANLKTQKRKLFSDTLRELRRMGLKLHTTKEIQKMLSSVSAILANTESLSNTSVDHIDGYFFRLLDLLPRMRASVSALNEEIPPAEALKGLAAAENLIFTLIASRQSLIKTAELDSSLSNFVETFEKLADRDLVFSEATPSLLKASVVPITENAVSMANNLVQGLPKVIEFALVTIASSADFNKTSYDTVFLVEAKNNVSRFVVPSTSVYTVSDLEIFNNLNEFLYAFNEKLTSFKKNSPAVAFAADFIKEWLEMQKFDFNMYSSTSLTEIKSIEDVESAFRELSVSILVSIQKITKLQESKGTLTEENDNWLVDTQRRITKYSDLLFPLRMASKLSSCVDVLCKVEFNEDTSKLARALVVHSLPLIKQYKNTVTAVLMKMRENYIGTAHGAYMLASMLYTISKDGFCSPEPPSDQKDSGNMQDGTGLGDGDGATNNSKDVEDDEDLSEQAQQPNEENRDKDDGEEDNDDAVDIEGDMAGNLEEAPPEDEDDKDKDGEDEDEDEDLDDEVDDIDDMDPNAIDEKMWDEEATEGSKEKDSDKMPDDSNAQDDMQAMEDEEEDDSKNDKDNKQQEDNKNPDEQSKEDGDEEDKENDEDGDNEEDVGQQDDEVKNEEDQQLDADVPEAEVLDLPDEINLDSDKEGSDDEAEGEEGEGFEDKLDDLPEDEEEDQQQNQKDVEMTNEEENENEEGEEEVEGESNNKDEEGEENEEEEDENMADEKTEVNEDEGVASDEELMDVDDKEGEDDKKNPEEEEGDNKEDNIEGLDGAEDGNNDDEIDADTAVQQKSGMESEGADADVKDEQDNIGTSGGAASFQDQDEKKDEQKEEEEEVTDSSRDQASESLKQLGDSLKEFHRRRQEIKEATDDDMVDQQTGERPDEFQHLEGENTENDTQALGAANQEQIQSINDDMAIDDDEEEKESELKNEEDEKLENIKDNDEKENVKEEELQDAQDDPDADFNGETKTAMIGERKKDLEDEEFSMKMEIDDDEEDDQMDEDSDEEGYEMINNESSTTMRPYEEAQELWKKSDEATRELTAGLCEQLRLILEPTLATKLKGDYKTGKRLNMKRIIPYIASQFRKDKIWMRRTKPSKRQYQIMIAVDDSKSMAESKAVEIAFQSIALVSKALTQLESGQLSIVKFGEDTKIVHPFEKQFSSDCGISTFQEFEFEQTRTDIRKLVNKSLKIFNDARGMGSSELWQLQIILSDGVCEDHETIQRLVRQAREEKIMLVFVIIDGVNNNESIMDMSQVNYITDNNGQMKLQVDKYLDSFPFEFYVVVHNIAELPEMLSLILRQYFSELASA
ncbi:hypothetical protein CANARDRAFT_27715 [[Candida] arabinofermentans NRRL YB-2248]|uniref:Midasin n=1 Tax=[Candida] arabinofermentans NRRL YB-2248 TaxID=983967 RepID=A0A1E4T431_9ASCO|nr:hypothetical protein CANARDRAFT_27715 [[Candida] arabinofermentans NRRL YB-2248]